VTVTADDVLPAYVKLPEYWAVMVCGPTARADVWRVVTVESRDEADWPRVVAPSLKVTVPVGTVRLPTVVKVAVKVTVAPAFGLVALVVRASVVEPCTVNATTVDVLDA
jgi:hypothetical protein